MAIARTARGSNARIVEIKLSRSRLDRDSFHGRLGVPLPRLDLSEMAVAKVYFELLAIGNNRWVRMQITSAKLPREARCWTSSMANRPSRRSVNACAEGQPHVATLR